MNLLFRVIPKLSKIFSHQGNTFSVKICLKLWYFVLSRKFFRVRRDFPLRIRYEGKIVDFYLRYPMDIAVLYEIFIAKEYEWCHGEPKIILDLGAHFGDTALYYNARFPDATIYAIEPFPENFERLCMHVKNIPQIVPIQCAVGKQDGQAVLNIVNSTLGHSLVGRESSEESVLVTLRSLDSLIQEYKIPHIDLLKFDIEGAEFDLLETLPTGQVSSIIGELHFDLVKGKDMSWIKSRLPEYDVSNTPLDHPDRCVIMAFMN
jgi:FkbM family methyltransferase